MSWDVAPSQDIVTQAWGCTTYSGEWVAPWCPSGYYHAGIDLGFSGGGNATCGRPVYATRAGTVAQIGTFAYGGAVYPGGYLGPDAVCVKYDDGAYVWHGHLASHTVSVGQRVNPGDQLGTIGTQGASTACHLHVEARTDGPVQGVDNQAAAVIDPAPYLNLEAAMTPEEHAWLAAVYTTLTLGTATPDNPATLTIRDLVARVYNDSEQIKAAVGTGASPGAGTVAGLSVAEVRALLTAALNALPTG